MESRYGETFLRMAVEVCSVASRKCQRAHLKKHRARQMHGFHQQKLVREHRTTTFRLDSSQSTQSAHGHNPYSHPASASSIAAVVKSNHSEKPRSLPCRERL